MGTRHLKYAAGAVGVIAGAAVAGFGSGIGMSYGRHLMASGQLPLPGAPKPPRRGQGRLATRPEQSLIAQLKLAACFRRNMGMMPKGFTYYSAEDFILDRGKPYSQSVPLNEREWAVLDQALGSRQCRQKECYHNAQLLAVFDPSKKLKYVEGYAVNDLGIGMHHAWVTLNGKVIDLTWRARGAQVPTHAARRLRDRVVGVIPEGWAYYGVQFPASKIRQRMIANKETLNFIGDWKSGYKEFKWKRKGALDCSDFPTLPKPGGRAPRATWKKAPGKQNPRVVKHFKKYIISFDHPTKSDYVWTSRGQLKPGYKIPKLMEFSSESQAAAVIQREVLDYIVDWKQESFEAAINGWAQVGKRPRGSRAESLTNWSRIHRKVGPKGTYCFGSAHRIFEDPAWEKEFYRQAWGHRFRVRVQDGVVYLDSLA